MAYCLNSCRNSQVHMHSYCLHCRFIGFTSMLVRFYKPNQEANRRGRLWNSDQSSEKGIIKFGNVLMIKIITIMKHDENKVTGSSYCSSNVIVFTV